MALGSNITAVPKQNAWDYLMKLINNRHNHPVQNGTILKKAGVPATNTAADDPGAAGRFIIDTTNDDVYFCSAYTNSTTFTIVKLT
jgi:hypothetical protein